MDLGPLDRIRDPLLSALRGLDESLEVCRVEHLPKQASTRSYHRVHLAHRCSQAVDRPATIHELPGAQLARSAIPVQDPSGVRSPLPPSVVVMLLPDDPFASDEAAGSEAVRELPFCNVARFLAQRGVPVPRIYHDGATEGFLLLEDLGDKTMLAELKSAEPSSLVPAYKEAIDLLVRFQEATRSGDGCVGFLRRFGHDLLRWELDHFREWLLDDWCGARLSPVEAGVLKSSFDDIASRLADSPYILAHRDFQSTNLMRCNGRLVVIDFQDALMAPAAYDIVALLRDSYVVIPPADLADLVHYYFEKAAYLLPVRGEDEFNRLFCLQALQRKLKDAGRFVFIDRKRGNPGFLRFIPDTLGYVRHALAGLPEYQELAKVLEPYLGGRA